MKRNACDGSLKRLKNYNNGSARKSEELQRRESLTQQVEQQVVSFRQKVKELQQQEALLARKSAELQRRESSTQQQVTALEQEKNAFRQQIGSIQQDQLVLQERENALQERENALQEHESILQQHQNSLLEQERMINICVEKLHEDNTPAPSNPPTTWLLYTFLLFQFVQITYSWSPFFFLDIPANKQPQIPANRRSYQRAYPSSN